MIPRKTRKVNGLRNSPTKKKNVISFLCREYLSLENIHQLSQLQLSRFISFFPLDIRIYRKFFLILVNYFFVSLNPHFSNVTFLYSLKRLNLKVWWCLQGISKCNSGKIWVKSTNFYHTILKFMPFEKMFDNFFSHIVKINTRKILNRYPFARISICKRLGTLRYIKDNFPLCMLTCFCCQDIRFQISLMKSITLLLKSLVGNYVTFGNWMFFQNNQNITLLTLSTF